MPLLFREHDRRLLISLRDYRRQYQAGLKRVEWARTMDVGGTARSDHAAGLARLLRLGLVERRQRVDCQTTPYRSRASYEYRISGAGIEFVARSELKVLGG